MKYFVLFFFVFFLSSAVNAHSKGFTYESAVGEYFVDIGASKLDLVPDELVLFEYNLFSKNNQNKLAEFGQVYVTIGDAEKVLLATYVHRPEGLLTTLSFSFPKAGTYEMTARFEGKGETMAEVKFPIDVKGGSVNPEMYKYGAILVLVGLALGYTIATWSRINTTPFGQDK